LIRAGRAAERLADEILLLFERQTLGQEPSRLRNAISTLIFHFAKALRASRRRSSMALVVNSSLRG
jgi:hypothetical protein